LVAPCRHSFASVLSFSVYGKGGKLDKAVEMFDAAQELGLPIDEKIYTNMLSLYGKAGQVLMRCKEINYNLLFYLFYSLLLFPSIQS
jgi:pentatricopeptide repeat protein